MTLSLSRHAHWRQETRAITDADIAAALAGFHVQRMQEGDELFVDKRSRVAVLCVGATVVTVMRLHRKNIKRWCSR